MPKRSRNKDWLRPLATRQPMQVISMRLPETVVARVSGFIERNDLDGYHARSDLLRYLVEEGIANLERQEKTAK